MNWRLGLSSGGLPWFRWGGPRKPQQRSVRANSSGASSNGTGSYLNRVKGWQGPYKAGMTSGTLSAMGDLLAQLLMAQANQKAGKEVGGWDPVRTLRMFGYGFTWYGPCQFYWYNLLEHLMPIKNTGNFLAKVAANQLILAPITLSTVFAWTLGWTGQSQAIPAKLRNDLVPTMMNGWKFWIPAASINFYLVPVEQQVLYMSCCGVLWTAYLSYASVTQIAAKPEPAPAPAAETDKKGGKGGKKAK